MFKIDKETKEIHLTRGDIAAFNVSVPLKNEKEHVEYHDENSAVYWYDVENKIVYDNAYNVVNIDIKTLTMQLHTFEPNDVLRFKVVKKGDHETVFFSKDEKVEEPTQFVPFSFDGDETKIGDYIDKPTDYWYEVELNPETKPQTIICYDMSGPKIFKLYPEGAEHNG